MHKNKSKNETNMQFFAKFQTLSTNYVFCLIIIKCLPSKNNLYFWYWHQQLNLARFQQMPDQSTHFQHFKQKVYCISFLFWFPYHFKAFLCFVYSRV